jgi:hypothetical protein
MATNMEKFFSIFGKLSLIVIVLGSLTYAGYYFGKQSKINSDSSAVATTSDATKEESIVMPSSLPMPVATSSATTTVLGGLPKSAGLSFDQYSIVIPSDWTSKKESQTPTDEKLILEKDGYSISILQAATGGALCLYPGDGEFEGPSSKFQEFTTLTTKDNRTLRRSGDKNGTSFTVCQKSPDNSYQQPTNYGHISIKVPATWNSEGLKVIDSIISSLKKM